MSVELHHTVHGPADAPPLVLGGSLGSTLDMWEPQIEALSARFRLIRIDHRGHGGSPDPEGPYTMADLGGDVLALLDRLGIERAHYAGLSLGGMIGQWLAIEAPERIDRLVLMSTSPYMGPARNWRDRAAVALDQGTGALAPGVVERWFTPDYAKEHPEDVARLRSQITDTSDRGYAGCCGAIEGHDTRADLGRIVAPTLVVSGAEDPSTPFEEHGSLLAEGIPGARNALVENAAHLLSWERSDRANALLVEHLTATAP